MRRAWLPLLFVLPLGCRGTFDITPYVVDDSGTSSDSASSTSASTSESGPDPSTDTDTGTDTDTSTDTGDECPIEFGSVCLGVRQTIDLGVTPTDIAIGNFDDDGHLDVLVTGAPVEVRLGDGSGSLPGVATLDNITATGLAVADLDDDGDDDILALTDASIFTYLFNSGAYAQTSMSISPGANDGITGHLDSDTNLDFAASNPLRVYLGNGDGTWISNVLSMPFTCDRVALGQFDGEAGVDAACAMVSTEEIRLFRNSLNTGVLTPISPAPCANVTNVTSVDFTGNGTDELITIGGTPGKLRVYFVQDGPAWEQRAEYDVGSDPRAVAIGDIDGDGTLDAAVANSGSRDVSLLRGDGTMFLDEVRAPTEDNTNNPRSIAIADLDFDEHAEVIVGMVGSDRLVIYGVVAP